MKRYTSRPPVSLFRTSAYSKLYSQKRVAGFLSLLLFGMLLANSGAIAQTELPDFRQNAIPPETKPDRRPATGTPNQATLPATVQLKPLSPGQYVLEFNRSPVVGTRLQLRGIYDESRLRFTRPRSWETKSVKVSLRFRHSPALYATRSNLTVLVNGASVGSVPLNKPQGEIGNAIYDVPISLLQDYNEVVIAALQNNSPTCTQDPYDPSLWTEILPDSKIVFDLVPRPVTLDFSRYPFPLFDELSLSPNELAYLLPSAVDEAWLTAASRFQSSLGRLAQFRPIDTRLVKRVNELSPGERLVVIGTTQMQPVLKSLKLPLKLQGDRWLDETQKPIADDVGVLMLTTSPDAKSLVLVATGNTPAAASKAVQFLLQSRDRQIGTGSVILVKDLTNVPTPDPRDWPGYLPIENSFQLKDLLTQANEPFQDITTRGSDAPPIEIDFRALPDDRFLVGNVLNLRYSYGPQLNPLTSLLEVQLDGLPLAGRKLDAVDGVRNGTFRVDLPADKIKPNSKLQIRFRLDPRERRSCNRAIDQQLWGTVHADTSFELKRENMARVPDLKLLQVGYPFAAPQDLSQTAIALPQNPNPAELLLLLEVSERLGRLSKAESIKLNVYRAGQLPDEVRKTHHLIALGERSRFPLPEAFPSSGFNLEALFERKREGAAIRTLPDVEGVAKQIVSPWNGDRVFLALTGQSSTGIQQLQALFEQDALFYQLREDTVLISANDAAVQANSPDAYTLEFLQQARQRTTLSEANWRDRLMQRVGGYWLLLIPGTILIALLMYGAGQAWLNRYPSQEKQ
ncbi:MAG: cellulose biosynthesis cyclic di-GMP-binding regulatory protein BcsB [Thermoleptolyngbya sp. C42_A2020_037]|nr:cellulose biosynthesis cyclic di-GMP-binding regulatory protein BcsB [Thermoleptolyngbya sp. C42_A2020_037]